jgi:KAP-like P-loop domain-containing protein
MDPDIDDIWRDDLLRRKDDARFIFNFIENRIAERGKLGKKRSFVLNIDADWGEGKSFFIERLSRTIEKYGCLSVLINAWADDHADDPLIAVMTAIGNKIETLNKISEKTKSALRKVTAIGGRIAYAATKGVVKQAAERYIGTDGLTDILAEGAHQAGKSLEDVYDAEGKKLFDKFAESKKSMEAFKKELRQVLTSLKKDPGPPLFVLIDELDRCRPTYAIAILERVKHLFDIDDVVFVFATNADQLQHSIAAAYGAKFDAPRYLHRFFDQTYRFSRPNRLDYVISKAASIDASRLSKLPDISQAHFTLSVFDGFALSLRDIDQCMEILHDCVTAWTHPTPLQLPALLPLIVAQQKRIEVIFDNSLVERIQQARGIQDRSWGFKSGEKHVQGPTLFAKFVSISHLPMRDFLNNPVPSENTADWFARDAIVSEARHRADVSGLARSWISEYPELVRTAGRFMTDRAPVVLE